MRRMRNTTAGLLGAAATMLLHALFFAVAMWDVYGVPRVPDRPDAIGAGANLGDPHGESVERRIVVRMLSDIGSSASPRPMDAFLKDALQSPVRIDVTGPDSIPLPPLIIAESGLPAESTNAELIARERMVGIYQSQIRARIERAWSLPTDHVSARDFSCRAQIRQHRDGRIGEVELPYDTCNETPAMRQSLIDAIFTASPLPAPPHPGVFVESFSLILRSESARTN